MHYWIFTFAVLSVLIPSIISLNCYVCNSNTDDTCATGSDLEQFAKPCNQTVEPFCRKIDQTVDGKSSIIRTCGSKIGSKACYKTAGTNSANVCSCNEDLCNNARSLSGQQRILTIISSIIILAVPMLILR